MDVDKAKMIVANIGTSYFYDDLDRFSVDEIINTIRNNILQTSKLIGLYKWEEKRNAYLKVISDLSQEDLNILLREYALEPEQVGGSRALFQRLATEIDKAIQQVKPKLIEKAQHETPTGDGPPE